MSSRKVDAEFYMPHQLLAKVREKYQTRCREELIGIHLSNFLWNTHIIRNYPGILGFERIFRKTPAVVVGVGPSLDRHIALVKEYRKNILLIAADAALHPLRDGGVTPDLVVMVDPTEKQKDNFDGIDTRKFYTITNPVVHPSIFRVVDPKHLALYNIKDPGSDLLEQIPQHTGRIGGLPAAVLTTGSCYAFALGMGCDPVTFIGQDLSWPTPDKVYAKGVSDIKEFHQKSGKLKSDCLLFPDIHGKLVITHQTFLIFWAWMRDTCRTVKCRTFNSSEAGILKTKEIKAMPFKRWITKYAWKELVGVKEKLDKAYNHRYADGNIDKILMPEKRKLKGVK